MGVGFYCVQKNGPTFANAVWRRLQDLATEEPMQAVCMPRISIVTTQVLTDYAHHRWE